MAEIDRLIKDLEEMRVCLHDTFNVAVPELVSKLNTFADELDETYKAVKVSKVAGNSACIVGGVLAAIGFGLSFVTFGASLGLCIAGGVLSGGGGITTGGASIAVLVKAKKAKEKAKKELHGFNKKSIEVLEKWKNITGCFEKYWDIEKNFPTWFEFWKSALCESAKVGGGCVTITKTICNVVRASKGIGVANDAAFLAAIPVFRVFGKSAAKFVGGAAGAIFLPFDVYGLVSNAREIHKNTAHKDAERIREIVREIEKKRITTERIDEMIDSCVNTVEMARIERQQLAVQMK